MSSKHTFAPNRVEQKVANPDIDGLNNVIVLNASIGIGNLALKEVQDIDPDPHGSLGGGVRPETSKQIRDHRRIELTPKFGAADWSFQKYVGDLVLSGPDGKAFVYGTNAISKLAKTSKGNPAQDIPDYLKGLKRTKSNPLHKDERATRILEAVGLAIIGDALTQYRVTGDANGAAKTAVKKIGGNYANLHTDYTPGGAVELFENVIETSRDLLRTFGVFRNKNGRTVFSQDPSLVIADLSNGLAKTAGYKKTSDIPRGQQIFAASLLPDGPVNNAA